MNIEQIVLSIAGFFCVFYIKQLSESMKDAVQNIKDLNAKMAIIIERTETHAFEIESLRNKQDNLVNDIALLKASIRIKE